MTESGPGAVPIPGGTPPEPPRANPPSPFSREGSQAADGLTASPSPASSAEQFEPYQPPPADGNPYTTPSAYPGPFSSAEPYPASGTTPAPPPPGFDPQPVPPYGSDGTTAPYVASSAAYGSNPYEYTPYQPAYGGNVPYGVVQVSHPKATTAMVFGILGIVLGLTCGIGGLLGIVGIVQGRRVRAEIDAEPGRYSGRSQAVAGIITGIVGVVIAALVIGFAVLVIVYSSSGDF
jgi:Domain of unknown function (DUF4190)